jgi:membrane associated rhomboid family serine protease
VIPIRDINARVRFPIVNYLLIAICILGFLFELSVADANELIRRFGAIPADMKVALEHPNTPRFWEEAQAVLTAMFLHGSWIHIIGNMLYLRVFGDNIEDRFGHAVFFVFYLASGVAGWAAQYAVDPDSNVPMIGASGAIAGVLGAYIVLFPTAKIVTLFPVFIFLTFIEVPAFFFLGLWAAQQLLNVYGNIVTQQEGDQIAWFAHIGGFALGLVTGALYRVIKALRRRRRR